VPKIGLEDLDHPLVFSFTMSILVIAWIALLSWLFCSLNWTGPLGLVKGGVVQ
jgi:hypothetical protein